MSNRPLSDIDFCVIDTETTGGNAVANRVIDVAVFRFRDGEIVDKFETPINPGRRIPFWITQLTGINDDMVKNAPTFEEVAEPLRKILEGGVFTAHNAKFDFGFISEEYKRLGQEFKSDHCCTLKLARHLYSDLPSRSLGALCESLLIDIWDRHRASGDAEATVYVLKEILSKAKEEYGVETWEDLKGLSDFGRLKLPDGIAYKTVSHLPQQPGLYIFKDQNGKVVQKGSCKDVRRRVRTYFQESNQSKKSNYLREVVKVIEFAKGAKSRI